jgi:thymidylate synthase
MALKAAFTEILGFCRGETDVRWYQDRGCKIWNGDHERWHGKDFERDKETFQTMLGNGLTSDDPSVARLRESLNHRAEHPYSLGEIYGAQWRNFNGYDQLEEIVYALKNGSNSRRLIMSAWAPNRFHMMSLPPCHVTYHFVKNGDRLDISMHQRSCDTALGVPFNWANTALLCYLVANAAGLTPGRMVWFGDDVHVYEPHLEALYEQVHREPQAAPMLRLNCAQGTMPWEVEYEDIEILGYEPHPAVKYELFVG